MSTLPSNKRIVILGGGTNSYISNHFAVSAPAYGQTAIQLAEMYREHPDNKMDVELILTKMADPHNPTAPDTPEDVEAVVDRLVADPATRVIVFNIAMVDFKPTYLTEWRREDRTLGEDTDKFGKYVRRISTAGSIKIDLELQPYQKIINKIRKERKDILLVGFKTTCGATKEEQYEKGLKLCKDASANIVFVNDVAKDRINAFDELVDKVYEHFNNPSVNSEYIHTNGHTLNFGYSSDLKDKIKNREYIKSNLGLLAPELQNNGLVTPEESSYWYNTRREALEALVQMSLDRTHLHFTRSTVIDSETVAWNVTRRVPTKIYTLGEEPKVKPTRGPREIIPNPIIPETFRTVFDWVRSQGAYKKGPTGATVGHFGIKLGPNEFLTSKRKTDFNKIEEVGLVRVITDDPDNVFGYKHFFETENVKVLKQAVQSYEADIYAERQTRNDEGVIRMLEKQLESVQKALEKERTKVLAFGAKPSVGGQSQRSLFDTYPELDCIVHFHCPLKTESRHLFTTTPQFSYECGSKECIASNISGFQEYKVSETHSIWAGHMDYHGPNIVFSKDIDPQLVIDFISKHWDLSRKTDGLTKENI